MCDPLSATWGLLIIAAPPLAVAVCLPIVVKRLLNSFVIRFLIDFSKSFYAFEVEVAIRLLTRVKILK